MQDGDSFFTADGVLTVFALLLVGAVYAGVAGAYTAAIVLASLCVCIVLGIAYAIYKM
jgi:hypothetical protein